MTELVDSTTKQIRKGFLNIGEVTLVIRKQNIIITVQNCDFNSCRTDVNPQGM